MDPISARGLASVSLPQMTEGRPSGGGVSEFKKTLEAKAEPPVQEVDNSTKVGGVEKRVDSFVRGIEKDGKFLDRQMNRINRGADLSPSELLQLQGVSYRHAQQVELAAKMVEKIVGGFKQVLNTQV